MHCQAARKRMPAAPWLATEVAPGGRSAGRQSARFGALTARGRRRSRPRGRTVGCRSIRGDVMLIAGNLAGAFTARRTRLRAASRTKTVTPVRMAVSCHPARFNAVLRLPASCAPAGGRERAEECRQRRPGAPSGRFPIHVIPASAPRQRRSHFIRGAAFARQFKHTNAHRPAYARTRDPASRRSPSAPGAGCSPDSGHRRPRQR